MNLTRKDILKGNYIYPKHFVTLKPTKHFISRVEERGLGLEYIPTVVRITDENIYSAVEENNKLKSVVIKLKYRKGKDLFLVFNPFNGSAISMWFLNKKNGKAFNKNNQSSVPDDKRGDDNREDYGSGGDGRINGEEGKEEHSLV